MAHGVSKQVWGLGDGSHTHSTNTVDNRAFQSAVALKSTRVMPGQDESTDPKYYIDDVTADSLLHDVLMVYSAGDVDQSLVSPFTANLAQFRVEHREGSEFTAGAGYFQATGETVDDFQSEEVYVVFTYTVLPLDYA